MIDPNIALAVKPPQLADPVDQYGRALNLLAARQQIQMAPLHVAAATQQIESGRLANEKAQTDIDEEKAFKQALGRGAKPLELLQAAPRLAGPYITQALAQEKSRLEQAKTRSQMLSNALGAVKYAPEEARPQIYQQVRASAIGQGYASAEEVPEQYDPSFVDQKFRVAIDADKQIDDHQKELDYQQKILQEAPKTAKEWNDLVLREGSAAKSQAELDQTRARLEALGVPKVMLARTLPGMWSETAMQELAQRAMTPEQRSQAKISQQNADTAAKNAENNVTEAELAYRAKHDPDPQRRSEAEAALKRLDASRLASRPVTTNNIYPGVPTTAPTGAAGQVHGDEYLKTLPPAFASRLKQMAAGNEQAPTGRAAMSGPGLQLMTALYQYEPEWTPLLAQQRRETLKEFTSTQTSHAGGQLLALNTLVHHADLYLEVAQALKNGSWRAGNDLYNRVASAFGATPPGEANLVARFLAGETGKVATGGIPAEGEVNGILANMRNDGSPEQMQKAGERILQIAAGRMVPLKERRDQAKLQNFVPILGPDAKAILERRGFDPETMKPRGSGGQSGGQSGHVIEVGGKHYRYNGSGATNDLKNYTEIPNVR